MSMSTFSMPGPMLPMATSMPIYSDVSGNDYLGSDSSELLISMRDVDGPEPDPPELSYGLITLASPNPDPLAPSFSALSSPLPSSPLPSSSPSFSFSFSSLPPPLASPYPSISSLRSPSSPSSSPSWPPSSFHPPPDSEAIEKSSVLGSVMLLQIIGWAFCIWTVRKKVQCNHMSDEEALRRNLAPDPYILIQCPNGNSDSELDGSTKRTRVKRTRSKLTKKISRRAPRAISLPGAGGSASHSHSVGEAENKRYSTEGTGVPNWAADVSGTSADHATPSPSSPSFQQRGLTDVYPDHPSSSATTSTSAIVPGSSECHSVNLAVELEEMEGRVEHLEKRVDIIDSPPRYESSVADARSLGTVAE
ncbi:hypothetical protein D9758_010520 [Tetrapyrgos nigripes]|uniref:Uncharacterized protein n=1 Tax=Tetrapyrgos nigripes TaxID=182062 RepID=A0A8H5FV35_9AGAR|nr:hypothetical protein D9758_010520 [Tetrapyrgos nigripes]